MGKFNRGDLVTDEHGNTGKVLSTMESVSVLWDGLNNVVGTWPASNFELVKRSFKVGQFVRIIADDETNGEVGIIYEDDGDDEMSDPFWVALYDKECTEAPYSANELVPWLPKVGERVLDPDEDEDEEGTVIGIDGSVARVLWDAYPRPQDWLATLLEPVDQYDGEYTVGEVVDFTSPFLAETVKAEVTAIEGNVIRVKFSPGFVYADGAYPADMFSKAA